ncbi:MAG: hypothetical protein AAB348_01475 [Patescibacteria group bacterium]
MADNLHEKKLQEQPPEQPVEFAPENESQTEKEYTVEQQKEQVASETVENKNAPARMPSNKKKLIHQIPSFRDEVTVKIEKILEDGLNDSFQRLSPVAKQEFKLKGERAALEIRELLKSAHVKVKKILRLILDWLRMLPGINKFFLEQEAKIKTDKIVALKNRPEN